jgi:hypothetical protein
LAKKSLYFAEFLEGKKTILQAEYLKNSLVTVGSVAGLSGLYLLNTFIGGAGTYYELALLPLIFGYSKYFD